MRCTIARLDEATLLVKTNYSFEKRQRELAKKKQQDAKQAKKKAARDGAKPDASVRDAFER